MKKMITVLENTGYGVYHTDVGDYLVDYALNGVDRILQNAGSGAVEYLITEIRRNGENQITAFEAEEFVQEAPEAPGYES